MREFLWGVLFGAVAMYYYTFYGYQLFDAKQRLDSWRSHAVNETSGYNAQPKR